MPANQRRGPDAVLGAILAGGPSRRMGRDKALVRVGGVTMAERVVAAVTPVVGEVVVVGRRGRLAGVPCHPDAAGTPRGPLAGLVTALALARGREVLLVAVDHPFVRPDTLRALVALGDGTRAVVAEDGGHLQVACALYPGTSVAEAAAEDAAGGSIRSLLARLPVRVVSPAEWQGWGEDGRSWFSADDDTALEAGVARYG